MITYTNDLSGVKAETFVGFFEGWVQKPTPEQHLEILRHSAFCWLAFAGTRCVGFINAISDGFFYAAIPLLEVVPEYRGKGIGAELIRRMRQTLKDFYAVDLICDEDMADFYEKAGFSRAVGMIWRNYRFSGGVPLPPGYVSEASGGQGLEFKQEK